MLPLTRVVITPFPVFSINVNNAKNAIHTIFMVPTANMININAQQQPKQ